MNKNTVTLLLVFAIFQIGQAQNETSTDLDGKQLAKVTDNTTKSGMAYIVSSYYPNMFDNVTIDALGGK